MTTQQEAFLKFVRTKMIFSLRMKDNDQMQPIHIPTKEIETRFFPFPKFNRKEEIKALVDLRELEVTQSKEKAFFYKVLKPGGFDLTLLPIKPKPEDSVSIRILHNLKLVSLSKDAPRTEFFDFFLKYKTTRPDLFFTVDDFSGRIHTPVTNCGKVTRSEILLKGERTVALDVVTMQPLILGQILHDAIGPNEYSDWIISGTDVYTMLQKKANLSSREEAKKKFFEIVFSIPSGALTNLFGHTPWIKWINDYKRSEEPLNPHFKDKPHSNLAWLLQTKEVGIMRKVWEELVKSHIPFLSVHDEIIVAVNNEERTLEIMTAIFSNEFPYFKICNGKKVLFETTLTTLATPADEQTEDNSEARAMLEGSFNPKHLAKPAIDPVDEDRYYVKVFTFLHSIQPGEITLDGLHEESRPYFMKAAHFYNGIWPVLQICSNSIIKKTNTSAYYPEYEIQSSYDSKNLKFIV